MADKATSRKALTARAASVGRRIDKVSGYLLARRGTAGEGVYCRNLEDVERRLAEIEQEHADGD